MAKMTIEELVEELATQGLRAARVADEGYGHADAVYLPPDGSDAAQRGSFVVVCAEPGECDTESAEAMAMFWVDKENERCSGEFQRYEVFGGMLATAIRGFLGIPENDPDWVLHYEVEAR